MYCRRRDCCRSGLVSLGSCGYDWWTLLLMVLVLSLLLQLLRVEPVLYMAA